MKAKTKISAYSLRSSVAALLFLCVIVALSTAVNVPNHASKIPAAALRLNGNESAASTAAPPIQRNRILTFADRVAYQRAIEEVYWRHRIWPKENAKLKPSLDVVLSAKQIESKVESYLRDSQALEAYRQKPITSEQLQAEMERMAQNTKQPQVLRELFAALGNDPFVIAECLVRPVLTERLDTDLAARDKSPRFALLRTQVAGGKFSITTSGQASYTLPEIDPCTDDTWAPTILTDAPDGRSGHTAVWTGSEMIVWGGTGDCGFYCNDGGRYSPSTDSWTATSMVNAPTERGRHTAVWNGSEMIVWGGQSDGILVNTGGRYNPTINTWTATSTTNAPDGRYNHTAAWTGSEMIVWGGYDNVVGYSNTGGRYNPGTDSWTPTTTTNAPAGRFYFTGIWTGSEMIVWGGYGADGNDFNTGGRYNPGTDSWTATSTTNAPEARALHAAVWTGSETHEMIVWGGDTQGLSIPTNTGGRYDPSTDNWLPTRTTDAPSARDSHSAVWTGAEMIIWGGDDSGGDFFNTGSRYDLSTDSWTATSMINVPAARSGHTAVWTGTEMIVWGGGTFFGTVLKHWREILRARWPFTYANSHSDSNSNRYFHSNGLTDGYLNIYCHGHGNSYSYSDPHSYSDANADADPLYGQMFPYAETASSTEGAADSAAAHYTCPATSNEYSYCRTATNSSSSPDTRTTATIATSYSSA